jgi:tetratricopeptide (TPR) repeat protein
MDIKNFIKKSLDDPQALFISGTRNMSLDKYKEAYNDFDRLVNLNSTKMVYRFYRGECSLALKKYEFALEDFEFIIKTGKVFNMEHFFAGLIKLKLGKYNEAITYLNKAYSDGYKYYYRGIAKFAINKYQEAIEDFTKSIETFDNEISMDSQVGMIFKVENDTHSTYLFRGLSKLFLNDIEGAKTDISKVSDGIISGKYGMKKFGIF